MDSQRVGGSMDEVCEKCGSPLKLLFTSWYCDCEEVCVEDKGIILDKETLQWMEDGGIGE